MSVDVLTFDNDWTPLDLLLFRRYGQEIAGLAEATLAQNPGLANLGVFPPAGTTISVTAPTLASRQVTRTIIKLYD